MAFKKKKKVLGEWRCYKNKIDLLFDLYSYYLMNNIYIVLRIILFQSCFCDATSPNTFFFLKAMIMITQGQESKHQLYPHCLQINSWDYYFVKTKQLPAIAVGASLLCIYSLPRQIVSQQNFPLSLKLTT